MESSDITTEQLMFSHIKIWKSSSKSQKDFCQEKDIAYHKFHYWLKKYSDQHSSSTENPSFMQVSIKHQQSKSSIAAAVEVVYPDGRRLIIYEPVEASFLRSLLG